MMDSESTSLLGPNQQPIPRDRFHVVYFIFYLLGLGSLIPWNFFTTATQYFEYKLRNITLPSRISYDDERYQTHLQSSFENYLAIAGMVSNVIFNFVNTALTKSVQPRVRMLIAIAMMMVMFLMTVVLVPIDTDSWQLPFFIVMTVALIIMSASTAIMCGAMFGLAAVFPIIYTQAAMGGQALGGTFAAVAQILSLVAGSSPINSALGYFICALVAVFLAGVGYMSLYCIDYSKHYFQRLKDYAISVNHHKDNEDDDSEEGHHHESTARHLWVVTKQVWLEGMTVFLVFFVTLSLYPAITASVTSMQKTFDTTLTGSLFTPVVCFLLFNLADWAGRAIAGWIKIFRVHGGGYGLFLLTLLRLAFIPLIMLCNVQPRVNLELVVFDSDWYPACFITLMGITNGYLGTLAMMYGPQKVGLRHSEAAGAVMATFMTCGLCAGSLFSMLLRRCLG